MRSDLKNSTPSPWKRRKTSSSATFCATGVWGLKNLMIHWVLKIKLKFFLNFSSFFPSMTLTFFLNEIRNTWKLTVRPPVNLPGGNWVAHWVVKLKSVYHEHPVQSVFNHSRAGFLMIFWSLFGHFTQVLVQQAFWSFFMQNFQQKCSAWENFIVVLRGHWEVVESDATLCLNGRNNTHLNIIYKYIKRHSFLDFTR